MAIRPLAALSAAALAFLAGAASAQTSVIVDGLTHTALGQCQLPVIGARTVRCSNLGSSGNDGVSIHTDSTGGIAAILDCRGVFATNGAYVRSRYKGWDGTIKGRAQMTGLGNGRCTLTTDFALISATGVHWTALRADGSVIAEGDGNGPTLTCTIFDPLAATDGSSWAFEAVRKNGYVVAADYNYKAQSYRCVSHPVTVIGLGQTPLEQVSSLYIGPLVSFPTPSNLWRNISSMDITGAGVPFLDVSNAALESFSWGVSNPSTIGPGKGGSGAGRLFMWGGVNTVVGETCDNGGGTGDGCDADLHRRVVLSGPGNHRASVDLDPDELVIPPNQLNPTVEAYKTASLVVTGTPGGSPTGSGYTCTFVQKEHHPVGTVTIVKLTVQNPPGGGYDISADASARGAPSVKYTMFLPSGTPVRAVVLAAGSPLHVVDCGASAPELSCNGRGGAGVRFGVLQSCPAGATITYQGQTVPGVAYMTCEAVAPTVAVTSCDKIELDALGGTGDLTIHSLRVATPAMCAGIPVVASPGASFTLTDTITNFAQLECKMSGPRDWVKLCYDKAERVSGGGGGVGIDLTPLLTPAPVGVTNAFTFDGVDDDETPNCSVRFTAGSTARTVLTTYEDPDPNDTSVEWTITDANGAVLASGVCPPELMSCTIDGEASTLAAQVIMTGGPASSTKIIFSAPVDITPPGTTLATALGKAINTKPLTGTANRVVEGCRVSAVGLDTFTLSNACLAVAPLGTHHGPLTFTGQGLAVFGFNPEEITAAAAIRVSNLGSTGQDGVALQPFQAGDFPTGEQLKVKVCDGAWSFGSSPSGGHLAVAFRGHHPVGTVTIVKFVVTPDSSGTGELYTVDATELGLSSLTMRGYGANGQLITMVPVQPGDSIRIPTCTTDMPAFTCEGGGGGGGGSGGICALTLPGLTDACYSITVHNQTFDGVQRLVFSSDGPVTLPAISDCLITGQGLDTFTLDEAEVVNPCPPDLGVQGGGPGHDGLLNNNDFVAFINYFFTGDLHADLGVQGGTPGKDGLLNNNDFVVFIDEFFHGCP